MNKTEQEKGYAHVILVESDLETEMAKVSLNGKVVMEGNFWDFYSSRHGIHKYGNFESYIGLSNAIYQTLVASGVDFRSIKTIGQKYKYNN